MKKQKKEITFSKTFSKTWKDYTTNFKSILIFMLVFSGLPALLILIFNITFVLSDESLLTLILFSTQSAENFTAFPISYITFIILSIIISSLLYFFTVAGLTNISLKKKKFTYHDIVNAAKQRYLKFVWLNIVFFIFIGLLSLLLIIPGIIFIVYWVFFTYVFYDKKTTILGSLKQSRKIVSGKWWKTLGITALIFLLIILFSVLTEIITLPTLIYQITRTQPSALLYVTGQTLETIKIFIQSAITTPFLILFFKNLYQEMKKKS